MKTLIINDMDKILGELRDKYGTLIVPQEHQEQVEVPLYIYDRVYDYVPDVPKKNDEIDYMC